MPCQSIPWPEFLLVLVLVPDARENRYAEHTPDWSRSDFESCAENGNCVFQVPFEELNVR